MVYSFVFYVNRSFHHNSIIFTLAVPINMSEAVVDEKSSGIRNLKSGNHGRFEITALNNYYICKFQKGTEPGVSRGEHSCWYATYVANAPWKYLVIRLRLCSISRSENRCKVLLFVKSLQLVKLHNIILYPREGYFILLN